MDEGRSGPMSAKRKRDVLYAAGSDWQAKKERRWLIIYSVVGMAILMIIIFWVGSRIK